ncbi:MAG: hypothetical protein RMJ05_00075 [Thermomicrobium sp.]|nr:hypothetical protein [Thermomicrobium sp.]MDW8005091.1 hypothetical protein [Thermomicrobium sp.]
MERRWSTPQLLALGCLALFGLLVALVTGGALGYLAYRAAQSGPSDATPTVLARHPNSAAPTHESAIVSRPTPSPSQPIQTATTPQARPTATTEPAPAATPTQPAPTAPPAPTPVAQPSPTEPPAPAGPASYPGWTEYRDPGYIRFQHPPNWLVVTTPEAPEYNMHSCHCYWIVMSEQMLQNGPSPEVVKDWFNTRDVIDLPPGSVYIEILRLDSEYAPPVTFGWPSSGSASIGNQYEAVVYSLEPLDRIRAYRYTDRQGRPWVIVVRAPDGFDPTNPQVQRLTGILATIDHR